MSKTTGTRCPHCRRTITTQQILHPPSTDAAVDTVAAQQDLREQATISQLQKRISEADRISRDASKRNADIQKRCATLFEANRRLKGTINEQFVANLPGSSNHEPSGVQAVPPDGWVKDPLVSRAKLQHFVAQGLASERAMREQLTATQAATMKLEAELRRLRALPIPPSTHAPTKEASTRQREAKAGSYERPAVKHRTEDQPRQPSGIIEVVSDTGSETSDAPTSIVVGKTAVDFVRPKLERVDLFAGLRASDLPHTRRHQGTLKPRPGVQ